MLIKIITKFSLIFRVITTVKNLVLTAVITCVVYVQNYVNIKSVQNLGYNTILFFTPGEKNNL